MVLVSVYRRLSSIFPRRVIQSTARLLVQGGFEEVDARTFLGFALFFSLAAGFLIFFLTPFFFKSLLLHTILPFVAFIFCLALFYVWMSTSADSRARKIEQMLPIALQMISANIRAGMTLENAVWSSARPEFGPFKDEVERMSASAFGGASLTQAFKDMTVRVNSAIVERAIRLINEGIILGGEMAHLLDQVAFDIRSIQLLQREIAVATTTYAIFIVFAAIIAAPLLFAVSTYYAVLNEQIAVKQLQSRGSGSQAIGQGGPAGIGGIASLGSGGVSTIKSEEIRNFAIASISVTAFFAALIIGLMREGKASRGLKFIPVFIIIGLVVYLFFFSILQSAFTSIIK